MLSQIEVMCHFIWHFIKKTWTKVIKKADIQEPSSIWYFDLMQNL